MILYVPLDILFLSNFFLSFKGYFDYHIDDIYTR